MTRQVKSHCEIFVVDDDVGYLNLLQEVGAACGIPIDCFTSLQGMKCAQLSDYKVAIVDVDIGGMNEEGLSGCFSTFLVDKLVILTSVSVRRPPLDKSWPRNVIAFVHKARGPLAVLQLASTAAQARSKREDLSS